MNNSGKDILEKLNISLSDLAETLPTPLTTDSQILEAEKHFVNGNLWEAFHYFSLTHSTLVHHRLSQKLNRPQGNQTNDSQQASEGGGKEGNSIYNNKSKNAILRSSSVDETMKSVCLLPSDWTVVQITSENRLCGDMSIWKRIDEPLNTPPLYISRCHCGPSPSIIIRKLLPGSHNGSTRSLLQEIELIKAENKVINKYYMDNQKKYLSKRDELNNRLRMLVQSMESGWLQHLACLLSGSLPPHYDNLVESKVKSAAKKCHIDLTEEQLIFLKLAVTAPPPQKTKGNVAFNPPLKGSVAFILSENARSLKVKNLTVELIELQKEIGDIRCTSRNPVILVLDKSVVTLPWEMIWSLHNQSVTRIPSLSILIQLYLHHSYQGDSLVAKGIDASRGFYILDPENNLPRTQKRLNETFLKTGWNGVTGKRPSHDQFRDALTQKDVFVYVGHGSGSQYMPAHAVETVDIRSLVFLYGCSSASLAKRGLIPDPWGVVLNYLIASCPCVVGMLWEVMDKDTDLLTKEMIRALQGLKGENGSPLENPPTDLPLLVAKARPLCSWYLISAALVVYGLPLQVVPQTPTSSEDS